MLKPLLLSAVKISLPSPPKRKLLPPPLETIVATFAEQERGASDRAGDLHIVVTVLSVNGDLRERRAGNRDHRLVINLDLDGSRLAGNWSDDNGVGAERAAVGALRDGVGRGGSR